MKTVRKEPRKLQQVDSSRKLSRNNVGFFGRVSGLTDEVQQWIGRDTCISWFHCECVNIAPNAIPDNFVCTNCAK